MYILNNLLTFVFIILKMGEKIMMNFDDVELDIDNLFTEETDNEENITPEEKEQKEKEKTTELNEDDLFPNSTESVGGEENEEEEKQKLQDQENAKNADKQKGKSPNTYTSLANALKNDGILSELEDKDIEEVTDAESFANVLEKQLESRLEATQKRIKEALDNNVEVSDIRNFESTINYLDSIKEDTIKDESEKGENLRKQLIYTDLINRGYSKEKATKKVNQSFDLGTDIEDAQDALESNKEFYANQYKELIEDAKKENEAEKKRIKKEAEELQKKILDTETPFGDLKLDKATRQKVFDAINKPVYKDEDGTLLTAIQKYQKENKADFLHKLGVLYTLTDGFKNMNNLIKGAVKKEAKKGLSELDSLLNNSKNFNEGSLSLMGSDPDNNTFLGLRIDV